MHILAAVRESLGRLGIYAPKPFEKFQRFNKRNVCGLSLFMFYNILSGMSLIYDAVTISEYSDAIFIFSKTIILSGFYINVVVKAEDIFKLFDKYENIIEKRKCIKLNFIVDIFS